MFALLYISCFVYMYIFFPVIISFSCSVVARCINEKSFLKIQTMFVRVPCAFGRLETATYNTKCKVDIFCWLLLLCEIIIRAYETGFTLFRCDFLLCFERGRHRPKKKRQETGARLFFFWEAFPLANLSFMVSFYF